MFLSELDKELISKLKGRLSKALNVKTKLSKEDRTHLETVYEAIDKVIIGSTEFENAESFQKVMATCSSGLKVTRKKFIKEHIIPLINKIATKKWGSNE